jgi:hypothetical protein
MAVQKQVRLIDDTASSSSQQARAGRSPSYPAFGLEIAVSKLKTLYKAQRNNAVSVGAALETLGYKAEGSGTAGRNIAALIAYGLLSEEGSGLHRKVRITELGRKIVLLEESDPERVLALQEAALNPRIYRDMHDAWPESLPSDSEMKKFLTFSKGYNEETVKNLIRDFRATYEYAELDGRGSMSDTQSDGIGRKQYHNENPVADSTRETVVTSSSHSHLSPTDPTGPTGPPNSPPPNNVAHLVHLPGDRTVYVYVPRPFSHADFARLEKYLDLFKDVIVSEEPEQKVQPVRTGPAIWKNRDTDLPISVIGDFGEVDGRRYVKIEGSTTGVPLDEVEYDNDASDGW